MWVRGLKQHGNLQQRFAKRVAPYVGAWIETDGRSVVVYGSGVAPYVGAWIETIMVLYSRWRPDVAPYVGAWIETLKT